MAKKAFWIGCSTCIILVIIFTHSLSININKPLSLDHWDAFIHTYIIKHYLEMIFTFNWGQIAQSDMYYGFQNSQFYSDPFIAQTILTLPFYFFTKNMATIYHLLSILTLILTAISMYIFVYFLTRRVILALLGAIIYTFNPFTLGHFPDQLQLYSLQWIPMIFLFLERSFKNLTSKNTFLFFLFLTIQIFSSLYYIAFLSIILPIYGFVRIVQARLSPKKLLNLGTIFGFILFGLSCAIIIYIYQFLYSGLTNTYYLTTIAPLGSASIGDYLFTTSQNFLYGKGDPVRFEGEHSLFWGITPAILFVLSFMTLRKSLERKIWLLYISLLILSLLISFGPQISITNNLKIPGIYSLIYYLDPLFHNIRALARMGVFVFFFLSLIVVLATNRLNKFLISLIIVLILIEYWIKPFTFAEISEETTQAYTFLNSQSQIQVLLEFPIASNVPINNNFFLDDLGTHYLLYASLYHNKKLINGSGTYFPPEYQRRVVHLNRNFPTKSKLAAVKQWGANAIMLHKEEFKQPEDYELVKNRLSLLNVPLIYSSPSIALFDLTKWTEQN